MQFVSFRRRGDLKITALGDDGKSYHFMNAENAANWMKTNTTNIPTLASIAPGTAVLGGIDITVTLTGTNFAASSEVLVNNAPFPKTFISATSMTIVLKPSQHTMATILDISVRNGLFQTPGKPFSITAP